MNQRWGSEAKEEVSRSDLTADIEPASPSGSWTGFGVMAGLGPSEVL